MTPSSVVPETPEVTEAEFSAAMLTGLARCARKTEGKRALAAAMDLSTKGLDNILLKGAMPGPKRLWDARNACPTALDDIARLYGVRIVPEDSVCNVDDAGVVLAGLLQALLQAEHPDSPGGRTITHNELLSMEDLIRAVHAKTGKMLTEIDDIRRPRAVA